MSNGASYYALTLVEQGASTTAYYSLTPTSNLEMSQGGVTMDPTAASATLVNIYPQTLQIQAPAGSFQAGVTIVTSDDRIAGRLLVSPPVRMDGGIQPIPDPRMGIAGRSRGPRANLPD